MRNYQKVEFVVSKQLLPRQAIFCFVFFFLYHKQWQKLFSTGVPLNCKDE